MLLRSHLIGGRVCDAFQKSVCGSYKSPTCLGVLARRLNHGTAHAAHHPHQLPIPVDPLKGLTGKVEGCEAHRDDFHVMTLWKKTTDEHVAYLAKTRPPYFKWRKDRYMTFGQLLGIFRLLILYVCYVPFYMLTVLEIIGLWSMDMIYYNEFYWRPQFPNK